VLPPVFHFYVPETRNNSLFYKTEHGAEVGDGFMSLIHTCRLNGEDPFHYLTELQLHHKELAANPAEWMPWNYRETLARIQKN
jgi:transposase